MSEIPLEERPDLPKTRSGKIMRRLLRDIAEGRALGDTTTLPDAEVVRRLQASAAMSAGDRSSEPPIASEGI